MTRTILITGTSSGLDESAVFEYEKRGWNVVATMRDVTKANPRFAELPRVLVTRLDVTDRSSVNTAVSLTNQTFGPIDAVLNAAGYGQVGAVEEVTPAQIRTQYETNVVGAVNVVQAVLPQLRERSAGHILIIGSMGGHVSFPTMSIYASTKFALRGIVEGLAMEVEPLGINVTLVEPAGYMTKFFDNVKQPETRIDDYKGAYVQMEDFANKAHYGNIAKSMAVVAEHTGTSQPPAHLAVNPEGLTWVRTKVATQLAEYTQWESVTLASD